MLSSHASLIVRRVLTDDVYDALMEALLDQELAPGSRINADQLRDRYGVSITPLREALARLESDGLVVKVPHRGYLVSPVLDTRGFEALYEMRLIVEPEAANRAALRATPAHVRELANTAARMHTAHTGGRYREFSEFARADAHFHQTIALASENEYIVETIDRLRSHLHLSRLYTSRGVLDAPEALEEHDAIVAAIEQGAADEARALMESHLRRSQQSLRSFLEAKE